MPLCLASCNLHKTGQHNSPPIHLPQGFSEQAPGDLPERWWESFNDPELNTLVEQTLAQNLQLRSAWARLDQARALAIQVGATTVPEVTLDAGVSRTRVNRPLAPGKSTGNLFSLGLAASYEWDVWGRIHATKRAAEMDVYATRGDLNATAITLAASVAETWFALVEQRAQRDLLNEQTQASQTFLDLTELRFGQGLASALDVYQQRQQLAATSSQLAPVEAQLAVLGNQLVVLLGGPADFEPPPERTTLPGMPPPSGTGIPANLLDQRPDVRAAFHRLSAADHRVAVAAADRLPAIRLTASSGYQALEARDIFDNWVWGLAGNLSAPIFDAGRRKAEVRRTQAALAVQLNTYGETILNAIREVEDSLVQERQQRIFLKDLDDQVDLAARTLAEARSRYVNGLSDYLPVLTALQVLQRLERERLAAHRALLSFRIQLYRALGGSWARELNSSAPSSLLSKPGDSQ